MAHTFDETRRLAMELSYEEREKLSEELWWSLHPPTEDLPQEEIDAAWGDEIKRRLDEIDSGAVKMIPLEEVLADMDAHIEAKRQASAKDEAA